MALVFRNTHKLSRTLTSSQPVVFDSSPRAEDLESYTNKASQGFSGVGSGGLPDEISNAVREGRFPRSLEGDATFAGAVNTLHGLHQKLQGILAPYKADHEEAKRIGSDYHPRPTDDELDQMRDLYSQSTAVAHNLREHIRGNSVPGEDEHREQVARFFDEQIKKNYNSDKILRAIKRTGSPLDSSFKDAEGRDYSFGPMVTGNGNSSPHSLNILAGSPSRSLTDDEAGGGYHSLTRFITNGSVNAGPQTDSPHFQAIKSSLKQTAGEAREAPLISSKRVPGIKSSTRMEMSDFIQHLTGYSLSEYLATHDSPEVTTALKNAGLSGGKPTQTEHLISDQLFTTDKNPKASLSSKLLARGWAAHHPGEVEVEEPTVSAPRQVRTGPTTPRLGGPKLLKPVTKTPLNPVSGAAMRTPHDRDSQPISMATSDSTHECPDCLYAICNECGGETPWDQIDPDTHSHKKKYHFECERAKKRPVPER